MGKIPSGKAWQPTPVFLPGKSHRQRSLVGYSPWGRKELDTTEWAVTAYFWLAGRSCHSMSQLKSYKASIHSTADYLAGAWGHKANLQSIKQTTVTTTKKPHFNFLKSPKIWKGTQSYWCVCWLEWLCGSIILIYNCIFVLVEITLQLNNGRWKGINLPTQEYKTRSREQASIWG